MDFWHFYIPIAAVGMLSVIYELRRKDRSTAEQRRLPLIYLGVLVFASGGIGLGVLTVDFCYNTLHLRGGLLLPVTLLMLAAVVLLTFLMKTDLTRTMHLSRKHRVASSAVMLLAYCSELTAFGFLIASSI